MTQCSLWITDISVRQYGKDGGIQVPLNAEIHETPACVAARSCQSPAACQ